MEEDQDRHRKLADAGRVQIIRQRDDLLLVITPYHPSFVRQARALGGRWSKKQHGWLFPTAFRASILTILEEVYGLEISEGGKCPHIYVRVESGIKCLTCGLFKERAPRLATEDTPAERSAIRKLTGRKRK